MAEHTFTMVTTLQIYNLVKASQLDEADDLVEAAHVVDIVAAFEVALPCLVDDDLVDSDKIGTSVFFWAFPSKATATTKRRREESEASKEKAEKRLKEAKEETERAMVGRNKSEERDKVRKRSLYIGFSTFICVFNSRPCPN